MSYPPEPDQETIWLERCIALLAILIIVMTAVKYAVKLWME